MKPKGAYLPQFDGLRALAVMTVVIDHFGFKLFHNVQLGILGVKLFFILSGFFITLSLLKNDPKEHFRANLLLFYSKRLLRIIPPYYAAILFGCLLSIPEFRDPLWWHLPFLTNFYIVKLGYWPDVVSHFWSLSVQEHFYFVWPFVLFFVVRKYLPHFLWSLIFLALTFRIICIVTDLPTIARWVMLPGCLDSFAVGALIALARRNGWEQSWLERSARLPIMALAFGCFFIGLKIKCLQEDNPFLAFAESFEIAFLAWLTLRFMHGFQGWVQAFLCHPVLAYLGKISYGIYIYHVLVIVLVSPRLQTWPPTANSHLLQLLVATLVTLAVAMASFEFMEKPVVRLKQKLGAKNPGVRPTAIPSPDPATTK